MTTQPKLLCLNLYENVWKKLCLYIVKSPKEVPYNHKICKTICLWPVRYPSTISISNLQIKLTKTYILQFQIHSFTTTSVVFRGFGIGLVLTNNKRINFMTKSIPILLLSVIFARGVKPQFSLLFSFHACISISRLLASQFSKYSLTTSQFASLLIYSIHRKQIPGLDYFPVSTNIHYWF